MVRDTEFLSSSSENGDGYQSDRLRDSPTSPTDTSEDSVEIKLMPISIPKNKRKNHEPLKVIASETSDVPLKKRIKFESRYYDEEHTKIDPNENPFRPWAPPSSVADLTLLDLTTTAAMDPAKVLPRHPGVTTLHRSKYSVSPSDERDTKGSSNKQTSDNRSSKVIIAGEKGGMQTAAIAAIDEGATGQTMRRTKKNSIKGTNVSPPGGQFDEQPSEAETTTSGNYESNDCTDPITTAEGADMPTTMDNARPSQQRNYKNMTRERRIEANARERTRVHTISAAFDTLRSAIPSYSNTQKLSKLSVLRVACAYIVTLSRIAGTDYSPDRAEPSVAECLDEVTKTIQTEGKIRKKKDE